MFFAIPQRILFIDSGIFRPWHWVNYIAKLTLLNLTCLFPSPSRWHFQVMAENSMVEISVYLFIVYLWNGSDEDGGAVDVDANLAANSLSMEIVESRQRDGVDAMNVLKLRHVPVGWRLDQSDALGRGTEPPNWKKANFALHLNCFYWWSEWLTTIRVTITELAKG